MHESDSSEENDPIFILNTRSTVLISLKHYPVTFIIMDCLLAFRMHHSISKEEDSVSEEQDEKIAYFYVFVASQAEALTVAEVSSPATQLAQHDYKDIKSSEPSFYSKAWRLL